MFIDFYNKHKKLVIAAAIILLILLSILILISSQTSKNSVSKNNQTANNNKQNANNSIEYKDNKRTGYDKGNVTEQTGLNITNYTIMDSHMTIGSRNAVINAVNYALKIGKSTKNSRPLDQQYQNLPDSITNSQLYPVVTDGDYYEATIDNDQITDITKWNSEFTLTTTENKRIHVRIDSNASDNRKWSEIEVTLLN